MKTLHLFLFVTLLTLLFFSCAKNEYKHEVSGRVTEFGTEKPLEGVQVHILDCRISNAYVSCDTAKVLLTDAAGNYSTPFQSASNGRTPMIGVSFPGYYEHDNHFIRKQNDNEIDFVLDPFAWLHLNVINEAPAGELNLIRVAYEHGLGGWNEFIGENVNINLNDLVFGGNREGFIIWKIYDEGLLLESHRDTLYIPAHDTLHYEIRY